jgi:hypothetical protein
MNALEFLRTVWPSTGLYILGTLHKRQDDGREFFKHYPFNKIEEAAAAATRMSGNERPEFRDWPEVFFACHTMKGLVPVVKKDGTTWMKPSREAVNALMCKMFYSDLDCGFDKDGKQKDYPSQDAGIDALNDHIIRLGLPDPLINSSGDGLHVYWVLDKPIPSEIWVQYARKLKAIQEADGMKFDPKITTDAGRVLRVVGTMHRKDRNNPKKVAVLDDPRNVINTEEFLALIDRLYAALPAAAVKEHAALAPEDRPSPQALGKACANVKLMASRRAIQTGTEWSLGNALAMHTTGGKKFGHWLASGHPDYKPAETEAKLDRIVSNGYGPTTCGKLDETYLEERHGGVSYCSTCQFRGNPSSSPVVFARRLPKSDLPPDTVEPKPPFFRTKFGIEFQPKGEGDKTPPRQLICSYDIYPIAITDEETTETKSVTWVVDLPRRGKVEVKLPIDLHSNEARMMATLANRGIMIDSIHAKTFGRFMSHYIRQLQAHIDEQTQIETMGWSADREVFIWGDQALTRTGRRRVVLAPGLGNVANDMKSAGTREGHLQVAGFYDRPEYIRQQITVLLSLGAPLLYVTDLFGLIWNVAGPSGANKSTSLHIGAGMYGRGEKYVLSAGTTDITANGMAGRVRILNSCPVFVDEITLMEADTFKAMVMSVTQGAGGKVGQRRNGTERQLPDTMKSTIMLCSSNNSAHSLLVLNNPAGTAGAQRVIEEWQPKEEVNTKTEGDAFVRLSRQHYGHIGPEFMQHVVATREACEAEIRQVMAEVDKRGKFGAEERFRAAAVTIAVWTCRKANALGLLNYDAEAVFEHMLTSVMARQRHIVEINYDKSIDSLAAFIESINSNILAVEQRDGMWWQNPNKAVHGALKGRLEQQRGGLYITCKALREYCERHKLNYSQITRELVRDRVMAEDKISLGRHIAEFASVQSRVFRIDLTHPLIAEAVEVEPTTATNVIKMKPRAQVGLEEGDLTG